MIVLKAGSVTVGGAFHLPLTNRTFSVTFCPRPSSNPSPIPLRSAPSNSHDENENLNLDSNDSGVETKPELLNEAQLTELAQVPVPSLF